MPPTNTGNDGAKAGASGADAHDENKGKLLKLIGTGAGRGAKDGAGDSTGVVRHGKHSTIGRRKTSGTPTSTEASPPVLLT